MADVVDELTNLRLALVRLKVDPQGHDPLGAPLRCRAGGLIDRVTAHSAGAIKLPVDDERRGQQRVVDRQAPHVPRLQGVQGFLDVSLRRCLIAQIVESVRHLVGKVGAGEVDDPGGFLLRVAST